MPALIVATAGLGVMPVQGAAAGTMGGRPAIAYVLNQGGYVAPINTPAGAAWKPIPVGSAVAAFLAQPGIRGGTRMAVMRAN
jgi:hypothetical protein